MVLFLIYENMDIVSLLFTSLFALRFSVFNRFPYD